MPSNNAIFEKKIKIKKIIEYYFFTKKSVRDPYGVSTLGTL